MVLGVQPAVPPSRLEVQPSCCLLRLGGRVGEVGLRVQPAVSPGRLEVQQGCWLLTLGGPVREVVLSVQPAGCPDACVVLTLDIGNQGGKLLRHLGDVVTAFQPAGLHLVTIQTRAAIFQLVNGRDVTSFGLLRSLRLLQDGADLQLAPSACDIRRSLVYDTLKGGSLSEEHAEVEANVCACESVEELCNR